MIIALDGVRPAEKGRATISGGFSKMKQSPQKREKEENPKVAKICFHHK